MPTKRRRKKAPRRRAQTRIRVQRGTRAREVPSDRRLRRWARAACPQNADVTLRIVGLREARSLNRTYRGRAYAPNVLSFAYARGRRVHGDIVLCHPVVLREARTQGKTAAAHYAHLVVHGVLHLRGFGHARRASATRMEVTERRILRGLGIPDPYVLPAHAPRKAG
ncbi:MAG: rRNA maturation RNase YbeY [Burkholderiales bacterium]|nr:rRNA maturation RNase YbeY [Burkholderiales bacterium]